EMGMFALKGEMSLKASQGKVEVQAQNNTMALAAGRKVSITAVDGDILFAAKKRITLIGGGSYLILQDGKIEYGTEHDYFRRTGHSVLTVPEAKPLKMPNMPFVEGYSEYFILQDQKTGEPLAGLPYTLSIDGREFEGVTDKNGYTQYAHTPESKNIEVNPHPELFNRMILNASYWDDATPLKLDFDKPTEE
ncbi:DUF2345 domain-containing protein, partial [Rahnella laticis]|uniref:DUF2345 domain-containing protein n=1 Tax=Rahnella laticis TaxID=2787622 RepID=UPI0018A27E1E